MLRVSYARGTPVQGGRVGNKCLIQTSAPGPLFQGSGLRIQAVGFRFSGFEIWVRVSDFDFGITPAASTAIGLEVDGL